MDRRGVLRGVAATAALGAGCLGGDEERRGDAGDGGVEVTGTSLRITETACGGGTGRASVTRTGDGVAVDGRITGGSGATAAIRAARYDADAGVLRFSLRSTGGGEGGCPAAITYRATATVEGRPEEIRVYHDGVRVDAVTSRDVELVGFDVPEATPGRRRQAATPRYDENVGRVVVEGTTWGPNSCTVPVLDGLERDGDRLTVSVATVDESLAGGCTEEVVERPYRVTVAAEPLPGTVVVRHDGRFVAAADRPTRTGNRSSEDGSPSVETEAADGG